MMGALATSSATAGYVMASRLSMVLLVGHQLMNLILTPRIGRFLDKDAWTSIEQEYHQSRVLALMVALGGGVVFVFAGEWILTWFGAYSEAFPMLLILVATYVTHVSFGMCGGYLNIAGYAGWTLATTMLVLAVNIGINYLLIPTLGGAGAALAMLVSFFLTNFLTSYVIKRLDDVDTYSVWMGGVTLASVAALLMAAYHQVPHWGTGVFLIGVIGSLVWKEIQFFESLAQSLLRLFYDAQVENQ
jgi:O-antigen/teichoic acid export membrane protein